MTKKPTTHDDHEYRDSPVAWFAMLERAIRDGDYERAAVAQRELKRLGVKVKFPASAVKPSKREETTK